MVGIAPLRTSNRSHHPKNVWLKAIESHNVLAPLAQIGNDMK